MYAFCNLHDVSWGTKGSDKADVLPTVSSKKSKEGDQAVVEETARVQEDLDAAFKETVTRAVTKVEVKEEIEKLKDGLTDTEGLKIEEEAVTDMKIGFFLHTPFPSSEIYR